MKAEVKNRKSAKRKLKTVKMWSRLQIRMTISYVVLSVAIALLLELLLSLTWFFVAPQLPFVYLGALDSAKQSAQIYALAAAAQGGGDALDFHSTFQPGQPSSLILPEGYNDEKIDYSNSNSPPQMGKFVLLLAPDGKILASSYPAHYPVSTSAALLLPKHVPIINNALAGKAGSADESTAAGHIVVAVEPVWGKGRKPIGAIYVQETPQVGFTGDFFSFVQFLLFTALFWLIITVPIGALFGVLTTRGLLGRLDRLVSATAKFANGEYTQRVSVSRQDEIGQLERQFNQMAGQLVENMVQRQALIEQNARLEERTRIEQELRTAHLIQHSLLPKEVPALNGWQIATYYQSAREVGGDLYDFLTFEDGRVGFVIGDVTDKGVPAAMVMASTRSMLRAAAQVSTSPGEVLARVNDLLYSDIPPNMFVTCFFAVLDPVSGKLRFANAGHDLPYRQHIDSVYELHATGMPLGLMPGMHYEEQEVIVAFDEGILFYSDGLVEAHNPEREMFGFPRLKALLQNQIGGAKLIDFLLGELRSFTGEGWEQEDDMTLLTLQRRHENERISTE
jgi:serine phosphatase RsbU (regulator of sigma subunit)